jgi:hypothetical protein
MHHFASARAASHPGHTSLGRVRSLIHFSNSPSRSRGAFLRPGFASLLRSPESRGGRSAEKRSGACEAPVGHAITRHARRLRGALRPITRDARLSALHRGDFGLPGPRFRLLGRPPSYNGGQVPSGSVQRAPRTQVVVPGGRGPCLPGRAVTSRRRRTPRLAPHSGSSLEHALNERGCVSSSIGTIRSQHRSCDVVKYFSSSPAISVRSLSRLRGRVGEGAASTSLVACPLP